MWTGYVVYDRKLRANRWEYFNLYPRKEDAECAVRNIRSMRDAAVVEVQVPTPDEDRRSDG